MVTRIQKLENFTWLCWSCGYKLLSLVSTHASAVVFNPLLLFFKLNTFFLSCSGSEWFSLYWIMEMKCVVLVFECRFTPYLWHLHIFFYFYFSTQSEPFYFLFLKWMYIFILTSRVTYRGFGSANSGWNQPVRGGILWSVTTTSPHKYQVPSSL